MSPDDPRHGTNRGYRLHILAGEPACDDCREAHNRWERQRGYDAALGRPRIMPSLGAQRRVHALQWLGWSGKEIAAAAGLGSDRQMQYLLANDSCHRNTWLAVVRAYDTLSMSLPPEETSKDKWRVSRVRGHARRKGWAPPLAWDNIDDPRERPKGAERPSAPVGHAVDPHGYDQSIVERILSGEWHLKATIPERLAVITEWRAYNLGSLAELDRRTGWNTHRDLRLHGEHHQEAS